MCFAREKMIQIHARFFSQIFIFCTNVSCKRGKRQNNCLLRSQLPRKSTHFPVFFRSTIAFISHSSFSCFKMRMCVSEREPILYNPNPLGSIQASMHIKMIWWSEDFKILWIHTRTLWFPAYFILMNQLNIFEQIDIFQLPFQNFLVICAYLCLS